MSEPIIRRRGLADEGELPASLHPVLRRIYASRGVKPEELALELKQLLPPQLLGIEAGCALLEDAIRGHRRIVIAGDYDADGATATALAILGLRALGATHVDYVVPDRFRMGYGLSPALAEVAQQKGAQLLVTVDNGIASNAGVARARELGMQVLVTDHHLPGPALPDADAIINPNQPNCGFPSKHLAGVGVMFYVLSALRSRLRAGGWFEGKAEPNLADYLDLVALGTVADLVKLDYNNRVLVERGLRRIRAGRGRHGIAALLAVAGREPARVSASDLGFVVGPRINAAGRLEDIRAGIECLLADDPVAAQSLSRELDKLNRDRREIEAQMRDEALAMVEDSEAVGVVLFDPEWHEGVVGLVASRVKEKLHRPSIAFARAQEPGLLKGSGRSIAGLHIRDALAAVDARHPGLILRFGGHAMAAGLSLAEDHLDEFDAAFDGVCREWLDEKALMNVLETDGELSPEHLAIGTAQALEDAGPWGQGFPPPLFEGVFEIAEARLVGAQKNHAKYSLRSGAVTVGGMDFGGVERFTQRGRVHCVYRLSINRYQGRESIDVLIETLTPAGE